jgi:predicted neuraminidase
MTKTPLAVAALAATLSLAAAAETDPAIVKNEFIFNPNPVPSCHATTIVETQEGLAAAWFAGTAEGKPDVCIWSARFVDGAWTKPEKVAEGAPHPCWNPVLFQPASGPLMLFYKVGPNPREWWGMLKTSTDQGKTWSDAQKLPEGILGPIKNKPVQLANGTIVCSASTESTTQPSEWRVHFEVSSDGGKNWKITQPSSPGDPPIDAIQPSILFLGGDKLMALGRTRQKRLFSVTSDDNGQSWGAMSLLDLPNPNSGTDAVTMKDGRHVLIYNPTERGRSPLAIAVSEDGRTWKAAVVLEDEPKAEFSYPAVIQTRDGLLHFTYTWKRKLAKHVVIDPAKLQLRDMPHGEWPNK